ncbi:FAD-dependent oxidoreductase [Nocardia fluminea]
MSSDYDVVVIGSGFGGSVSALRLTEKGYRVAVLEAGRRFADEDFPRTSWDIRKFLWAPKLGCKGIQRVHVLPDVVVLAGSGVGGGSLVYANTLYEPKSSNFYDDRQWAHITDWRAELAPYYDQAERMLGVRPNPTLTPADELMREVADDMGVGESFSMAPLGVFFGRGEAKEPSVTVADPYFGGAGPARTGCIECGGCLTGCRFGAKNTLVKNYLYLAEQAGTAVYAERTVTRVKPMPQGGYQVTAVETGAWLSARTAVTFTADQVIFAAGTWGTQQLLHRLKADGTLPGLSDRLGTLTRTNSEALVGVTTKMRNRKKYDFTRGVTITSSIHPDEHTHIEPNRYAKGSNAMGLMATVMTDGGGRFPRWVTWIGQVLRHPGHLASLYLGIRHMSERSIIALVMQTHDNSLTLYTKKRFGRTQVTSRQGHGEPNPTWIPVANEVMRRAAQKIDGFPMGTVGEIFDVPLTAHFLGGCVIGESPEDGVIDPYHRVYGHPGLHVVDGAAVSANIGVNPSLTITAQAERAMSLWPNKGETDTRPRLGSPYQRVAAVTPTAATVPAHSPAALRLPITAVGVESRCHQEQK